MQHAEIQNYNQHRMTARYTGEIPLEQVRPPFSSMELENIENGGMYEQSLSYV
jgi:hypothetical protein